MVAMSLKISSTLSLPKEAALWTFADLAIKGAGKTYAAGDLAEEMIKAGIPILVIDPIGSWWGLRVGAIDSQPGMPVVIFGGAHRDLDIPVRIDKGHSLVDENKLRLMVKSILEAGISAVLDTSELSKTMQRRSAGIVLNELFHLNAHYGTRHVFVEEADTICPQRLSGDVAFSAGALEDVVRRGGNFNLGCTMITQRSAVLNKDVLTQANCLIVLRILHKLDKDAVTTWVESMSGDTKKLGKWYDSLRDLKNGEAWIWSPEHNIFEKIKFRPRETLHATREYFQREAWEQKNIRLMDVGDFINKFKMVFEPKPKQVTIYDEKPFVPSKEYKSELKAIIVSHPEIAKISSGIVTIPSPLPMPKPEPMRTIDVDLKNTVFRIHHAGDEEIHLSTVNWEGKVVYTVLNDLSGKPSSFGQIKAALVERAWPVGDNTLSPTLGNLVKKGILVREGSTKDTSYRPPLRAKIMVVNEHTEGLGVQ